MRTLHLGRSSRIRREFSVEAMRLVLEIYTPDMGPTRLEYVIKALGIIHNIYADHDAAELSAAEQTNKIKKR
ncbi:hypothetical protein LCGC14_0659130 [marine sediment metagenome]|uniref:Uncharacterized protein n=1 Tax=marine sediment metagenome TaxID=412755 RepID=A0A0F9RE06_9ZZZZ